MKFSKSAVSLPELTNTPYALSATNAITSNHLSMLTFSDPYSACGVVEDLDVVVESVLETVGRTVVVWVLGRIVVVIVGRKVVVRGLSRVEGRYVKRVGTR